MPSSSASNGNYSSGSSVNGSYDETIRLKVLIVGAGIGGLAAAIAFRQQGHDVELFETSRFSDESGAAIQVTPNANGALHSLGIVVKDHGANILRETRLVNWDGQLLHSTDHIQTAVRWQYDWRLAHRAQLHSTLKAAALSVDGEGKPVALRLSTQVTGVDPTAGTIHLADGTQVHGDVIVGADGVHSETRKAISKEIQPFMAGQSAFRFMVTRKAAIDDPLTHELASKLGIMTMWYSETTGRRAILYPCSKDELMNFVMIYSSKSSSASGVYNQTGSKETMLEIYQDFDPVLLRFLSMANAQTVKPWPFLDMETLPSWKNGKLVLIGDAAHPFLPHLAQGSAQAIEDAVSLGIMLSQISSLDEVPQRLGLYEKARYDRANTIQQYSREVGEHQSKLHRHMDIGLSHDEFHASSQLLRQHLWSKPPWRYWRQPLSFGPMPGPRQDTQGQSRNTSLHQSTCKTASVTFKTSATLLRGLFPSTSYRFASLDTVAYASFRLQTLDKMEWLAGGAYNLFGLYIHGVEYVTKNGDVVAADFLPILFEDAADPIVSGREELGYPKIYCDIEIREDDAGIHATLSWRKQTWGTFTIPNLDPAQSNPPITSSTAACPPGVLVHKYVPATGVRGREHADADYAVYAPLHKENELVPAKVMATRSSSNPSQAVVSFSDAGVGRLPTLHHIIERLAEIPLYEIVEAKVAETMGVAALSLAMRLD